MFEDIESFIRNKGSASDSEYWPLLKKHLVVLQTERNGTEDSKYVSSNKLRVILSILISLINLIRSVNSPKQKLFFGASSRAIIKDCVLVDEFISSDNILERNLLYHCSNFEKVSLITAFKKKIIFENLLMKLFVVSRRLLVKKETLGSLHLSKKLLEVLDHKFDLQRDAINLILFNFQSQKIFYTHVLRWLKAKDIILISSYTKHAIVSAANELNVNLTEIQHGVMAPYHPLYSYSGRNFWNSSLIPKNITLTSEFWLLPMQKSNFVNKTNIRVVESKEDINLSTNHFMQSLQKEYVLFTGQGICYEQVFEFISNYIKLNPKVFFVYRPHPREHLNYLKYTKSITSSNFLVVDRDLEPNTKSLISGAKAHISIFSSCHFEALELLNCTYVLDIIENNLMWAGRGMESIVFFKKAEELDLH